MFDVICDLRAGLLPVWLGFCSVLRFLVVLLCVFGFVLYCYWLLFECVWGTTIDCSLLLCWWLGVWVGFRLIWLCVLGFVGYVLGFVIVHGVDWCC